MAQNNAINNKSSQLTLDPGASGDSFVQFAINSTNEFRIGVDDDAADAFKIAQGNALGTNDTFVMTASGERTMPLQPAFLATHSVAQNDVTGDGSPATVNFTTVVYDQGSNYDGTNTFTAPITGRYFFVSSVQCQNNTLGIRGDLRLITSNRNYVSALVSYGAVQTDENRVALMVSSVADMDAADTVTVVVTVTGLSGNTVDLPANVETTYLNGYLVC